MPAITASPLFTQLNCSEFQVSIIKACLVKFYVEVSCVPDAIFNRGIKELGDVLRPIDEALEKMGAQGHGMPCSSKADYLNEIDTVFRRFFGESVRLMVKKAKGEL